MIATFEQIKEMEQNTEKAVQTSFTMDSEVIKGIKSIIKGHKKASLPVLNSLLLEIVNKNVLKVTYSNSDLTIEKMFLVTVNGINTTKFLIPIEIFKGLKYIKKKELFTFVEKEDNKMDLYRNNTVQEIPTLDQDEYPKFNFEKETFETVETSSGYEYFDKKDLKLLMKASKSVSKSETRPVLTQIAIENKTIVSTDSHRLYKTNTVFNYNSTILISPDLVEKAYNLIPDNTFMKMEVNDQLVKITDDMTTNVYHRQLSGNFPQTSRLIPEDFNYEIKVEKVNELYDFLKNLKNSLVNANINYTTQKLELVSSKEAGTLKLDLPVSVNKHNNKDFKIGFASNYMLNAIEQMEKEAINIKFVSNIRPFIIDKDDNKNEFALLLPVRTK